MIDGAEKLTENWRPVVELIVKVRIYLNPLPVVAARKTRTAGGTACPTEPSVKCPLCSLDFLPRLGSFSRR